MTPEIKAALDITAAWDVVMSLTRPVVPGHLLARPDCPRLTHRHHEAPRGTWPMGSGPTSPCGVAASFPNYLKTASAVYYSGDPRAPRQYHRPRSFSTLTLPCTRSLCWNHGNVVPVAVFLRRAADGAGSEHAAAWLNRAPVPGGPGTEGQEMRKVAAGRHVLRGEHSLIPLSLPPLKHPPPASKPRIPLSPQLQLPFGPDTDPYPQGHRPLR